MALHHRGLRQVTVEDQTAVFRLLVEHREDLSAQRTRVVNRLHALLRALKLGGVKRSLSTIQAAELLEEVEPVNTADAARQRIALELLVDLRRLDAQLKDNLKDLTTAVAGSGTSLTQIPGLGPILAATILALTGDVTRFTNRDHYASYTGTAPVEASSGDNRRHRLSRMGNRRLNYALHVIALVQIRLSGLGQGYYQRKRAEGKTPAEARRSLKRHLSNLVYRHLVHDRRRHARVAAQSPVTATPREPALR